MSLGYYVNIQEILDWRQPALERGERDMQSNQPGRTNGTEKILQAFSKMQKIPKTLIRYGMYISTGILVTGMILVILSNTVLEFDPYMDMVSKEIVKTSFVIAAETIIGGLIMDYVFRK